MAAFTKFSDRESYFVAAEEVGLKRIEAEKVLEDLGRMPNSVELGMIGVMWSEHCSYKSSRFHLRKLPTDGPQVLQGPGENAGVVEFSDDLALCFKIESHNHPSFIEPYQGAATGVGGILRDIFTMGARPIAFMNSLRFGDVSKQHMEYLLKGVVKGIGGYGNCVGIPTVGGEVYFHPKYQGNILVNAFCLGILKKSDLTQSKAEGVGNLVVYLGSKTGRDGIHGATMASESFDAEAIENRPTVQVGDPFAGKLLMEATLEIMKEDLAVSIQDMGAAGLTCSCIEMSSKGNLGMEVNLNEVPARETGMLPYEFMLSESQERMLLVCKPESQQAIEAIATRWGVDAKVIGKVTNDNKVRLHYHGEEVACLPPQLLDEKAPIYERRIEAPPQARAYTLSTNDVSLPKGATQFLIDLLASPNIASRKWVYEQYDSNVGTDVVRGPGGDAAVMRVKGRAAGIAMTTNGNSFYCAADPKKGAMIAVAECARNLACVGATPLAVTNCLNFGNPERPEIMWQFAEVIQGMKEACEVFDAPVISGNVSFYNQHDDQDIPPTPVLSMVGKVKDHKKLPSNVFVKEGQLVYLLGSPVPEKMLTGEVARLLKQDESLWPACPNIDLNIAMSLNDAVIRLAHEGYLKVAHDCSEGGLAVALAECCNDKKNIGASIALDARWGSVDLFTEEQSRIIIAFDREHVPNVEEVLEQHECPFEKIGETISGKLSIRGHLEINVPDIGKHRSAFFAKFED